MSNDIEELFEEAYVHFQNYDLADAKLCLAKMRKLAPKDPRAIEMEGDVAREESDYEHAENCYKLLLKDKDDYIKGRGHLSLGYLYLEQYDRKQALICLEKAVPLLDDPERLADLIQAQVTIGEIHYDLGSFEKSAQAFAAVLEQYVDDELDDDCAIIYIGCARQLGDALRCLGKLDTAMEQYQSVASIAEELELVDEQANAIDGLGVIHQMRGDFKEAEKLHLQALKLNESLEHGAGDYGIVANLANLTRVHIHLEDWPKARKYASQLLEIETKNESTEGAGFAKLLLAECDIGTKNYAAADQTLQSLYKLFSRTGEADTYVNVISVLGVLRRLQGNLKEAEEFQTETLKISSEMNNQDFLLDVYDELGEIRTAQKRYRDARDYWAKAKKIAEDLKSAKMLQAINKKLANIENL